MITLGTFKTKVQNKKIRIYYKSVKYNFFPAGESERNTKQEVRSIIHILYIQEPTGQLLIQCPS